MKISISIDGDVLGEADEAAQSLGLSRSQLVAPAVGDFLKRRREDQMLRGLVSVDGGQLIPAEKRLLSSIKAKMRPVVTDRW